MNLKLALRAAKKVSMLILDVDGVLTDGGLYYDSKGAIMKRFDVQDGLGIKLAQAGGLEVAVVTGLDSHAVEKRVRELGVKEYHAGRLEKGPLIMKICEKYQLEPRNLAFLGDDWVDAGPLGRVGLPMAVCNAQPEIRRLALWVSTHPGGRGAVREAVRFILTAQGRSRPMWEKWRSGAGPFSSSPPLDD